MELASQILRKAQQLIVKHGWVKLKMGDDKCGYCMYGALEKITGTKFDRESILSYSYLSKILLDDGYPNRGIVEYNDYIAESVNQVIEIFNRAIQLAKLKERQNET